MKRIKQAGKELALEMFKWQIRFLPMPMKEQDRAVEAQRKAYGLEQYTPKNSKHK